MAEQTEEKNKEWIETEMKRQKSNRLVREMSRCLPEVTQWFYGFSLCLSWAVVHLVHLFAPSTFLATVRKEELCGSGENTSVPSLSLSLSDSINTHCLPLFLRAHRESKWSVAFDWLGHWSVITGCYTHSLNLASVSLSLLSHRGPGSFSDKNQLALWISCAHRESQPIKNQEAWCSPAHWPRLSQSQPFKSCRMHPPSSLPSNSHKHRLTRSRIATP